MIDEYYLIIPVLFLLCFFCGIAVIFYRLSRPFPRKLAAAHFSNYENSFNQVDCAICLEGLEKGLVTQFQCGHLFHHDCALRWQKDVCPLCKARTITI